MTSSVAVPTSEVLGVWHAATSPRAGYRSHLLAKSWTPRRGGLRPTLCGEWRRTWQRVDEFTNPSAFTPCDDCLNRALAVPAPAPKQVAAPVKPPVRIIAPPAVQAAPAAARRSVAPDGRLLDPQLAHAGMPFRWRPRRAFRLPVSEPGQPRAWREVDVRADGTRIEYTPDTAKRVDATPASTR